MKVLVTLPNGRTTYYFDIDVRSSKTIGRECLEKVCYEQNIECETEYFGLVYNPRRKRTSSLNLPTEHGQISPVNVSVVVPPVDSCASPSPTTRTSPCSFTVTPPVTNLLDGTPDLFGNQLSEERQWLNLRNPLGRCDGNFLRLALRVKFWVPVHLILQENVRNLFYMEARQDLLENRIYATDWTNAVKMAALIAQADGVRFNPECLENKKNQLKSVGGSLNSVMLSEKRRRGSKRKSSDPSCTSDLVLNDFLSSQVNPLSVYEPYTMVRPCNSKSKIEMAPLSKEDLLNAIAREHKNIADQSISSAKYWLLSHFGNLDGFGEEKFIVPKVEGVTSQVEITVGPEGVGVLYNTQKSEKIVIPFSAIQRASSKNKTFRLKYINADGVDDELVIKMSQQHLSSALYRSVTEKHDFYSCSTVRRDVTTQFIRDFKGTFLSILFNEDTELGKKYVFDIQRTCREVHDHARRYMHFKGIPCTNVEFNSNGRDPKDQIEGNVQKLLDDKIAEMVTCKICMDNRIDALFASCGHVSCMNCASQCQRCPLCRTEVTTICKLYLPAEAE